jgi:hypothetical protein
LILLRNSEKSSQQVLCLPLFLSLSVLLLFFLGGPHFNNDGLVSSKDILIVEALDCLLSVRNLLVQDKSALASWDLLSVDFLHRALKFDGDNLDIWGELEPLAKVLLSHLGRDSLDTDVGVVCGSQVLSNRVESASSSVELVFSLANHVVDNEEVIPNNFLVHGLLSLSGIIDVFEADESLVLKSTLIVLLDACGLNLSELSEKFLQLLVVGSLRESFDEKVVDLLDRGNLRVTLVLLDKLVDLQLLLFNSGSVQGSKSLVGLLLSLELDVGVPSALLAVREGLELA